VTGIFSASSSFTIADGITPRGLRPYCIAMPVDTLYPWAAAVCGPAAARGATATAGVMPLSASLVACAAG
jgi:hypothetical protein